MDISKLEAGPELDALIATNVMGWYKVGKMWCVGANSFAAQAEELEGCPKVWSPSTDITAAREIEEKIAELRIMLPYTDALKHLCKVSENDTPMTFDLVHASPFIRCQAALLAMTYFEHKRS